MTYRYLTKGEVSAATQPAVSRTIDVLRIDAVAFRAARETIAAAVIGRDSPMTWRSIYRSLLELICLSQKWMASAAHPSALVSVPSPKP
jgi:uncharacterized protein (DUF3084 family)